MRKFLAILLAVTMLLAMPLCASALDVKNSDGDYYDHEQTGVTIPYRLIVPEVYDERYVFPMVVFFHGAGERGFENERQLDNCVQQIADNMPKAIILAPQCTHNNQWVDTPWTDGCYSVDEVPESDEMIAVMDLIQKITQEYSVDKNSIYAAGISMGGFAVWDAMVRHNDVFAAGVAVCGAGDPSKAEVLKDTPMFVYHGAADEAVPVSGSTDMVSAIEAAGGTQVRYTEYGSAGHGIWGQVFQLEDLYKQLQRCSLSDRYSEPQQTDEPNVLTAYLPYIFVGVAVVVTVSVVVILICVSKNKKKEQN